MRKLIIDCETSASIPDDSVIEIGIVDVDSGKCASYNMKPRFPILPAGEAVHGISNDVANEYPSPETALTKMLSDFPELLEPNGSICIGWNVGFDRDRINDEFNALGLTGALDHVKWFDLMELAHKRFEKNVVGNYKLDTIYTHLFGKDREKMSKFREDRASHSAESDVLITLDVYNAMVDNLNDAIAETEKLQMVDIMPWGKHAGTPVKDLFEKDEGYVRWLCTQSFLIQERKHRDLLFTFKELGFIDIVNNSN